MMTYKHFTIAVFLFVAPCWLFAQRLMDTESYIRFFSEAPLEDIEAINESALSALDLGSGRVAVSMKMKDFHFAKSLMEEHFNENYVESEKYPKATFSGTIDAFDASKFNNLTDSLVQMASGKLTIHGVTHEINVPVVFKRNGDKLIARTEFLVRVEDYDIEVPTMLIKNIAEEVLVTSVFRFDYKSTDQ